MLSRVIAKNVGDVFLRHTVLAVWNRPTPGILDMRCCNSYLDNKFAIYCRPRCAFAWCSDGKSSN